jgi:tRNA threonylcarbamoyladenosine biosynthesis protein TsaE
MKPFFATTLKEIEPLILEIQKRHPSGVILLLKGTLGSGKTTFVQHFIQTLLKDETITSPTFSIMHEYSDTLFHYDIYRIGSDEFIARGLSENFEKEGFHFVEWADEKIEKLLKLYGLEYITLETTLDNDRRTYTLSDEVH